MNFLEDVMIFRKFKNSEEISFCSVDTPDEALEVLMDPMTTDYEEIMQYMKPTIYGWQAAMPKKPDGEPGDFWELKGFNKDGTPAEVHKVDLKPHIKAYTSKYPEPAETLSPRETYDEARDPNPAATKRALQEIKGLYRKDQWKHIGLALLQEVE